MTVDDNDYQTKIGHVRRFLLNGHRAKVVIRFRGREMMHKDQGRALLEKIANDVSSLGVVDQQPKMDGRNMIMMIAPSKQKQPAS